MGKLDIEAWMDKVLQNDLLNKTIDMGDVKASIDRAKWFEKDSVWVFRFMKLREDNIPSIVKENIEKSDENEQNEEPQISENQREEIRQEFKNKP